jgi:hypothetical protein
MASMKRSKKAQVAIEYIHTYGWVFLTALVVGGVLIYYNVGNAKHIVPMECAFLSGINCFDSSVDESLLSLSLVNEFSFAVSNITMSVNGTCNSTANTTDGNPYGNPNVMLANHQYILLFECQNLTNMRLSETIEMRYVNVETGQQHVKVGKLEYSPTGQ